MSYDYKNSEMEKWLIKNHMSTTELAKRIGCSRPVILKVKYGKPICPMYAQRIMEMTKGKIKPKMNRVGRERGKRKIINNSTEKQSLS
ncbi:MAG: hypothetical protein C5B43_01285 [Verrucomicrobia bacterium]|nr:MAG: hypothetical protein C5B43_01285 [Verrucomicrobiota bacterium]